MTINILLGNAITIGRTAGWLATGKGRQQWFGDKTVLAARVGGDLPHYTVTRDGPRELRCLPVAAAHNDRDLLWLPRGSVIDPNTLGEEMTTYLAAGRIHVDPGAVVLQPRHRVEALSSNSAAHRIALGEAVAQIGDVIKARSVAGDGPWNECRVAGWPDLIGEGITWGGDVLVEGEAGLDFGEVWSALGLPYSLWRFVCVWACVDASWTLSRVSRLVPGSPDRVVVWGVRGDAEARQEVAGIGRALKAPIVAVGSPSGEIVRAGRFGVAW